ncbi:MAG: divergent PAP2 family protein [Oscillospiraceae bacterium]
MGMFITITQNKLINICFIAWFIAQFLKTILDFIMNREFNPERLTGSGGMPSSHSALVISLAIGTGRIEGFDSTLFAISLVLAAVVIYDAMGVRRAAGEQAKVLNKMMFDFNNMTNFFDSVKKQFFLEQSEKNTGGNSDFQTVLKEYLGHTPIEVLAGCALGIAVALLYPI